MKLDSEDLWLYIVLKLIWLPTSFIVYYHSRNLISDMISTSFIMSFLFELFEWLPKIIHFVLLKFSVSLFASNQLFSFFNSFSTVSKSGSKLSPQQSKFVSSVNRIVFNILDTSHILFIYKINNNGPNTEPLGTQLLLGGGGGGRCGASALPGATIATKSVSQERSFVTFQLHTNNY